MHYLIGSTRSPQVTSPPIARHTGNDGKVEADLFRIVPVLIAAHDTNVAQELVQALGTHEFTDLQAHYVGQILKTFSEPEIIEALMQQAKNYQNNPIVCPRFLDVLSESEGNVPVEAFWNFAQAELPTTAKAYAIRGLGRFSYENVEKPVLAGLHPPTYQRLIELTNIHIIESVLQIHESDELIKIFADFAMLPDLSVEARDYLQQLLGSVHSASELMKELARLDKARAVQWSILRNSRSLASQPLQQEIPHLLLPLPYEHMLISNPCGFDRVQSEVFRILGDHGQIPVLAKAEYQSMFLYNSSSETLFNLIRRDKVYEAEQLISSIIDRHTNIHNSVDNSRTIVGAAWVIADLGNIEKAQRIINQRINSVDLDIHGNDWISADILEGIHLLPPDYALDQIEKLWPNTKTSDLILIRQYCIEALERIGTDRAISFLARIVQETANASEYSQFRKSIKSNSTYFS